MMDLMEEIKKEQNKEATDDGSKVSEEASKDRKLMVKLQVEEMETMNPGVSNDERVAELQR